MCVNCNDSLQVNLPIGPAGINGTNGQSAYVYIASATNSSGANFTYPAIPSQPYIAILNTTTPIATPTSTTVSTYSTKHTTTITTTTTSTTTTTTSYNSTTSKTAIALQL